MKFVCNVILGDMIMMIEADVELRGQNTADQQMMPIMARPPDVTSDLTLVEWLALVKGRGKGLKLDFKSIEAVEISLQRLDEIKEEVSLQILTRRHSESSNPRHIAVNPNPNVEYPEVIPYTKFEHFGIINF